MKTLYQCEICQELHTTVEHAHKCEDLHFLKFRGRILDWKATRKNLNDNSPFPEFLLVEATDKNNKKAVAEYTKIKEGSYEHFSPYNTRAFLMGQSSITSEENT